MAKIDSISGSNNTEKNAGITDLSAINPLIGDDGDTSRVSAVLSALSSMVLGLEDQKEITLDGSHFGIACILDVCSAALVNMR